MAFIGIDVDKSGKIWTSYGISIHSNISNSITVKQFLDYCQQHNVTKIFHEDNRCWDSKFRRQNPDLIKTIQVLKKVSTITLVPVKPYYTSLRCSRCGNVDKRSRISKFWYICCKCKFCMQADVNAARNILYLGKKHATLSYKGIIK